MKTKFPALQGFLIKPKKDVEHDSEKLNVSYAFVYRGYLFATDLRIFIFYDLKEYLKEHMNIDKDEETSNGHDMIKRLVGYLEGKVLSGEFFTQFSKLQEISNVDEFVIRIGQNGFHSETTIDELFNVDKLEEILVKASKIWDKERKETNGYSGLSISGNDLSKLVSLIKNDIAGDSIIFERTLDSHARFSLAIKEYVFGIVLYDLNGENSLIKFSLGTEFFEELG